MISGSPTTANSRFKTMGMLLTLVCLACIGHAAANDASGFQTEVVKTNPYKSNSTKTNNQVLNSGFTKILDRKSRALSQFAFPDLRKYKGSNDADSTVKSESKSIYIIPHMRPGRSELSSVGGPFMYQGKRNSDTLIPALRFGRSDTSLIPTPRLGRSTDSGASEQLLLPINIDDESDIEEPLLNPENSDELTGKREVDDNENIIPYPRLGRNEDSSNDEDSPDAAMKRESNDSLIPQIRYGRDAVKIKVPPLQKPYFILPNMRPGRSLKTVWIQKEKTASSDSGLVPYPRPGRVAVDSERFSLEELIDAMIVSSKQMDENMIEELVDTEGIPASKSILFIDSPKDLNTESGKSEQFVIPYPRPGKRNFQKPEQTFINKHLFKVKGEANFPSDYVLPYPRPGKRNGEEDNIFDTSNKVNGRDEYDSGVTSTEDQETDVRKRSTKYVELSPGVPSARLGSPVVRQPGNILPYPRPGRRTVMENDDYMIPQLRFGRSNSIVPYPRLGRSDLILPYPRLGRSNTVLPYPRLGRSDSILPYPRLGRSYSLLPQPRVGRADSLLPYPRLGRSDSLLPYPRLGRSESILPYPRLGRSDSILPYPRLGRSDSIVPYPRLGRSDSILPYPRLGRSDSILPYPRLGRSDSLLPYPRIGRSKLILKSILNNKENVNESSESVNNEDSNIESLKGNLNNEESEEREHLNVDNHTPSKKENEHILTGDSVYLLPYPRPGRNA